MSEADRTSRILAALGGADGQIYYAAFNNVAITAAQDVFELVTSPTKWTRIRGIWLNQWSDFGDAQAEILSVRLLTGHTSAGSGGSTITPVNSVDQGTAAEGTVARNNTTIASGGTSVDWFADAWNEAAGWIHKPPPVEQRRLAPSTRFVVRITAPADSITANGTLEFEEYTP